ncbi:MAG: type I secretion C-terminal target domain-containing protein, partial [Methylococcaceae bacterium]
DGNDFLYDYEGDYAATVNTINAGAGDDLISLYTYNENSLTKATGGTGQDTYEPLYYSTGKFTITDFSAGAGGDILKINSLLSGSTGYAGGNPFQSSLGYFRLVQEGTDTLLQWDRDGTATSYGWKTSVRLQNTPTGSLTDENFTPANDISTIDVITNHLPTGDLQITGQAILGQTLNAENSLADADNLGTVKYQWLRGNELISGATNSSYLLTQDDLGKVIRVKAGYLDGKAMLESKTSAATAIVDDYLANTSTAGNISEGHLETGVIQEAGDSDWLRVNLQAGNYYVFELKGASSNDGTLDDPYLQLLSPSGAVISFNDDNDGTLNAKIEYTATSSNSYYLAASGFATNKGSYTLSVLSSQSGYLKLFGTDDDDTLTGADGNDLLDGGKGNDSMTGGLGNDTYVVDQTGDTVTELSNGGTDTIISSITRTLDINVEKLALTGTNAINGTGNTQANSITGNTAKNLLNGGKDADVMAGGSGNDTYIVDNTGDKVIELANQGTDTVRSAVDFSLTANLENLLLTGTKAVNGTGNALANSLTGNSANNTLLGNQGDDILIGGKGKDTLTGSSGADHFVFKAVNESGLLNTVRDIISDFNKTQDDKIDLSSIDANSATPGVNNAFTFIGTAAFSNTDASNQLRFDTVNHVVYGSTDADNAAEFSIEVSGVPSLISANFIL